MLLLILILMQMIMMLIVMVVVMVAMAMENYLAVFPDTRYHWWIARYTIFITEIKLESIPLESNPSLG